MPRNAFHRITSHNHRAWIGLCPEGTRLSPRKLLASRAFSRQHDKPELRHLLWPRTKGFVATVKGMRGHVEAVYDLSYVYVTPGRQQQGGTMHGLEKSGGRGGNTESRGDGCGKSARVPSLAELVGAGDLAREGYEFLIHVRRCVEISFFLSEVRRLQRWRAQRAADRTPQNQDGGR